MDPLPTHMSHEPLSPTGANRHVCLFYVRMTKVWAEPVCVLLYGCLIISLMVMTYLTKD